MQNELGFKGTLLEMLEWIRDCWDNSMTTFVSKIRKEPEQQSSGRRRWDYERIFEETLAQYEL